MAYVETLPQYAERDIPTEPPPVPQQYEPETEEGLARIESFKRSQGAGPGMVTIGQEDWRTGGPGPVPVPEGQGIRLTGGMPFKPEGPLPWWTIAYEQEKQKMAEEQRIRDLLQSAPFAQQSKALESAMRLEGNLGFAADIKAGVPIQQALAKHAGKIYYNAPSAHVAAMRAITRPTEQPFNFGEQYPTLGGTLVRTGRGSSHYVPSETVKPIAADRQLRAINATIKDLKDEADFTDDENRKAEIAANLLQLRRVQSGLVRAVTERPSAAAPSSTGRKVVTTKAEYDSLPSGTEFYKSDGKKYRKP